MDNAYKDKISILLEDKTLHTYNEAAKDAEILRLDADIT